MRKCHEKCLKDGKEKYKTIRKKIFETTKIYILIFMKRTKKSNLTFYFITEIQQSLIFEIKKYSFFRHLLDMVMGEGRLCTKCCKQTCCCASL